MWFMHSAVTTCRLQSEQDSKTVHGFTTPFSFPPTAHLVLGRDAYGSHGPHCRLKGRVRTVLRQEISQTLS